LRFVLFWNGTLIMAATGFCAARASASASIRGAPSAAGAPAVPRNCCAEAGDVMSPKDRTVTATLVASAPRIFVAFTEKCLQARQHGRMVCVSRR